GDSFDIHGGGSDLMFPHHENEIAQSEAATGKTFARYWMHNGPVRVDNEKMSKSLGNFFTVREVLAKYPAEVVRYLLVASHYRSPINYSDQGLEQAASALERLYLAVRGTSASTAKDLTNSRYERAFMLAMDDDFNSAEAIGVLFELARDLNKAKEQDSELAGQLARLLLKLAGVLGILQGDVEAFLQRGALAIDAALIDSLIAQRKQARADKDWALADKIRDQLNAMRVVIEDGAEGSRWRVER
ncbi:MAG: class I tRNA ligase family protein, partial [Pseudohongiella sp.]|nr:class I tRNA ligase family protein [Pseudohongiella sp.]